MKNIARTVFLLFCIFVLAGCAGGVWSKNLVGLEDYKLDPDIIDGMWIGDDGALLLKTVDRDKGILKVIILEDPADAFSLKTGAMQVRIRKGKEWLYFNVLPPDTDTSDDSENAYRWGRIVIKDRSIVYWYPSMVSFVQAIEERKLAGNVRQKKDDDGTVKVISALITDTPTNLVELIETEDKTFFNWDDPGFLLKITK
jgi:hypothetical protein